MVARRRAPDRGTTSLPRHPRGKFLGRHSRHRGSARLANGGGRGVFVGTFLIVAACAFFASRLTVDMSMKREFSRTERVRVDDAAINERFAGTNTLVLLVEAESEGGLEEPAVLQAMHDLERKLEQEPGVGSAISCSTRARNAAMAPPKSFLPFRARPSAA